MMPREYVGNMNWTSCPYGGAAIPPVEHGVFFVREGGLWKETTRVFARIGGSWLPGKLFVRRSGAWQRIV